MYKLPVEKLKEFKVGIAYLYGSVVQGCESELSDIDIGVVFTERKIPEDSLKIHSRFYQKVPDTFW